MEAELAPGQPPNGPHLRKQGGTIGFQVSYRCLPHRTCNKLFHITGSPCRVLVLKRFANLTLYLYS